MSSLNGYFTILIGFLGFLTMVNCKVRGIAGKDYPNYSVMPKTSFKCSEQLYNPGFYADPETRCQVFHYCYKHRKESFLCPSGTIFNQAILSCDYWYSSDCGVSLSLYNTNSNKKDAYVFPEKSLSKEKSPSDVLFAKMESLYELSNQTEERSNGSNDQHIKNILSRELQIGESTEGDLAEHDTKTVSSSDTKDELPTLSSISPMENSENLGDLDKSVNIQHLAADLGDDTEQYFFVQNEQENNKLLKRAQETVDNPKHSRSKNMYTILEPENTTVKTQPLPPKIRKRHKILVNHGIDEISSEVDFNDTQNVNSKELSKETYISGTLQKGVTYPVPSSVKLKRKKVVFLSNDALETKSDAPTNVFDEKMIDGDLQQNHSMFESKLKNKQASLRTRKNNKLLILNDNFITPQSDNNSEEQVFSYDKVMEKTTLNSRRKKKLIIMDDIAPINLNAIKEVKSGGPILEKDLDEVALSSANKNNASFVNLYDASLNQNIDRVSNLINVIERVNENRINQIENKVKMSDAIEQISESGNHRKTRNIYRIALSDSENARKTILGVGKSDLHENIVEKDFSSYKLPISSEITTKDNISNNNRSQSNFTILKHFEQAEDKSGKNSEKENFEGKPDGQNNMTTNVFVMKENQESYLKTGESENLHSLNYSSNIKSDTNDDIDQEAYEIISDEKKSFDEFDDHFELVSDDSTATPKDAFYHYFTTEVTWKDRVLGSGDEDLEDLRNMKYKDSDRYYKKIDTLTNPSVEKKVSVVDEAKKPPFYERKLRSFHLPEESENFDIYTEFPIDEAEQYTEQSSISELDDLNDAKHYENVWTNAYDFDLSTSPSTHFREGYLFKPSQHPIYKKYSYEETVAPELVHLDEGDSLISYSVFQQQDGLDSGSKIESLREDSTNIKPHVLQEASLASTEKSLQDKQVGTTLKNHFSAYENILDKSLNGETLLPVPLQTEQNSNASFIESDTNEPVVKFTQNDEMEDESGKVDEERELINISPDNKEPQQTYLVPEINKINYPTSLRNLPLNKINLNSIVRSSRLENSPVHPMNSMSFHPYFSLYSTRYGKTRPSKIVQLIQIGKMLLKMKRSKLSVLKGFLNAYAIDL